MRLEDAPTEFLEAAGIRFAHRRLGSRDGIPLLCLQHFTGTMDGWDPTVVNALAETRPVIVFDNAGVGSSSGTVPDNVERMAADARTLIEALGLTQVDLLGFSLGGFIAQVLAATGVDLIRRIVLAGTAPKGGKEHLLAVLEDAERRRGTDDIRLPLFFTPSAASQAAGRAFLERATMRKRDRDPESGGAVSGPQAKALIDWCANDDGGELARSIRQPALVASGSDDTMLPNANAVELYRTLRDAQLVLYPDSSHGALFQYPELFAAHVRLFLDDRRQTHDGSAIRRREIDDGT